MAKAGNTPCTCFTMAGAYHPAGKHDIEKSYDNFIVRQTDIFLAALRFLSGPPTLVDAAGGKDLTVDPANWEPVREDVPAEDG